MNQLALKQNTECALAEGAKGFAQFVKDPTQLGTVFQIAEKLVPPRHREVSARKMRALSPEVNTAFDKKIRLAPLRLEDFRNYPAGSLGKAYFDFMTSHGLTPDAIPYLESGTDGEFFMASGYETHDIWHVVTGFETDVAGELGLQGFYTAQTPAGLSEIILLGGFLNAILFSPRDLVPRVREYLRGRHMGKKAKNLVAANWNLYWTISLNEVRERFQIEIQH